jgi:branched-chain amino acid transport system permease protein
MVDATTATLPPTDVTPPASAVTEMPPLPRPVFVARVVTGVVLAVAAIYAPFSFLADRSDLLAEALYIGIAAMGLNLLTGFNGQVSIGHGAFFGVGAYTTANLMVDYGGQFESTLVMAALVSGLVGMVVGFPALRVRGLYLALVTLGLAVVFPQVADKYVKAPVTGTSLLRPDEDEFKSLLTFLDDGEWAYFVCLTVAAVLFLLAWNLVRSRTGRAMVACRDHELAAVTVGVNLSATKVGTFAISAAYAGVAGGLSVMVNGSISASNPAVFFTHSIEFLVAVVIGGAATVMGPMVGAFLLVALRRNTEDLIEGKEILAPALLGGALIAIVYVMPDGVVGGVRRGFAWLTRRSGPRGGVSTTAVTADTAETVATAEAAGAHGSRPSEEQAPTRGNS